MLPESSIQGHLFIKVRNCCSNPFIAANVTHAAAMDLERLRAGRDVHAGMQQQCGCSCTSFGLSLGKERLQGRTQAEGNLDLTKLHYLQLFQKRCWKWCGCNFSPWGLGSVPPGVGWGCNLNPSEWDSAEGRRDSYSCSPQSCWLIWTRRCFPLAETNG